MDEMIERCARSLAARHYAERFAKAKDDPHVQMNVDGNWHIFAEDARTVMGAMRGATETTILPGYNALMEWDARTGEDNGIADIWSAIIDAALSRNGDSRFDAVLATPPAEEHE